MLRTLSLIAFSSLVLSAAAATSGDWPQFRGPSASGVSEEAGLFAKLKNGPDVTWKTTIGTGFTSIIVAKSRVYACGNTNDIDVLYCFEAATGKPSAGWKNFSYPAKIDANMYEGGPNATPTISGDFVYCLSKVGEVFCVNANSGVLHWKVDAASAQGANKPDWGYAGSPLVIDGKVYVNVGKSGTCLDAATGAVLWKSGSEAAGYASVIALGSPGKRQFAVFSSDRLYMVKPDGGVLWEIPWATRYGVNAADPIIHDGQLFLSSGYQFGCAKFDIGAGTPKEVWRNKAMRNQMSGSVLLGGNLYGFDDKTLKCMSWTDGTTKWEHKGLGQGTLVAAENRLLILSEKGELVVVEAKSDKFTEVIRAQVLTGRCWSPPAIAGGRIFCRNAKGDLVAVELK